MTSKKMGYMDVSDQELNRIKIDFFDKHKSNIENGDYHPSDVERIRKDTNWIRAFYKHNQENPIKTCNAIHDVLLWRNEFDANNLCTPGKLPVSEEIFKKGGIFMRNEDINCIPMCHFVVKTHKKDQFPHAQICRHIAFYFERVYKFNVDDPIVLLFDMADAGYSNLDMEMIKFVVNCLKSYYPGLIDYMIIFQMPFIFNAAWKIIKNWLPPESVKLIKFVDKKSIREYVQESQLFVHMGGTDKFKYAYDYKTLFPPKPETSQSKIIITSNNKGKLSDVSSRDLVVITKLQTTQHSVEKSEEKPIVNQLPQLKNNEEKMEKNKIETIPRTESFVSTNTKILNDETETTNNNNTSKKELETNKSKNANLISNSLNNKSFESTKTNEPLLGKILTTPLLTIDPGDELLFNVTDGKADITQFIKLTNTSGVYLAYKIKITSPDKFRVKPGTGIIEKNGTVQIMINYLKEFHNTISNHRDKFLILWMPINDKIQQTDLSEFWKQAIQKKENLNDHKVKCLIIRPTENNKNIKNDAVMVSSVTSFTSTTSAVTNENEYIVKSLKKQAHTLGIDEKTLKNELVDCNHVSEHLTSSNLNSGNISPVLMTKLQTIDSNVKQTLVNQQKLNRQYSIILYSIYFLILINVIQIFFQSKTFLKQ